MVEKQAIYHNTGNVKRFCITFLMLITFLLSCEIEPKINYITEKIEIPSPGAGNLVLAVTNMSAYYANLEFYASFSPLEARASAPSSFIVPPARNSVSLTSLPNRLIRMDSESASKFNANPPPYSPDRSRQAARSGDVYTIGSSKNSFYVESTTSGKFTKSDAIVRAIGNYCVIWVDKDNYNSGAIHKNNQITSTQATALAAKFDEIYPLARQLLGNEYGKSPGDPHGGIDGDEKIHILIYDIDFDFTPGQQGGTFGYFWGKDEYPTILQKYSNKMEMFYIDAHFYDMYPSAIYSTLIHEFQHMINFNEKYFQKGLRPETWYNEMLSMLAEDIIAPIIGIEETDPGHPIKLRIPLFLDTYDWYGVDEWVNNDDNFINYSVVYAFGAYLIRNYGGPRLVYEMLHNNRADHASVTQALKSATGQSSLDFNTALGRYAEALLYSKTHGGITGKVTFDKDSNTYTLGGSPRTAKAFDIWNTSNNPDLFYPNKPPPHKGPALYGPISKVNISHLPTCTWPGHSVALFKIEAGASGTLYMELTRPDFAEIKLTVYNY